MLLLPAVACAAGSETPPGEVSAGVLSVVPPLAAVLLAILTRQVFISLFLGLLLGTTILAGGNPLSGLTRLLDTFLPEALGTPRHASVVLFSLFLGAMVHVIAASGGLSALARRIAQWAKTVRLGQLATWFMGIAIFFDDYANTLLVGNTMRPFTDRLKISREKLAYIVDSTAAPVASIMPISTWIGYEVGLIGDAFTAAGVTREPYEAFLASIPFRFYGILAITFVFFVGVTNRDLFSMHRAEKRARLSGKVLRDGATPLTGEELPHGDSSPASMLTALLPVTCVVLFTILGLYFSGMNALKLRQAGSASVGLREIIGSADSFQVLMWSAFGGSVVALGLSLRVLSLQRSMDFYLSGIKAMVPAMVVLVLAWALSDVTEKLKTAQWCVSLLEGALNPHLLPLLVFAVAAFISFATGTSWATMGILVPLVIPLAWKVTAPGGGAEAIRLGSIGAVLSGATFGDHCSPISDTTIMSSMASGCDHVDHVRTQIPCALAVAAVSMAAGYLPAGFGLPPILGLAIGCALLLGLLLCFGQRNDRT